MPKLEYQSDDEKTDKILQPIMVTEESIEDDPVKYEKIKKPRSEKQIQNTIKMRAALLVKREERQVQRDS